MTRRAVAGGSALLLLAAIATFVPQSRPGNIEAPAKTFLEAAAHARFIATHLAAGAICVLLIYGLNSSVIRYFQTCDSIRGHMHAGIGICCASSILLRAVAVATILSNRATDVRRGESRCPAFFGWPTI